jgi:hypothetical protein
VRRLPFAYSAYALSACLVLLVTPVHEGHEHFISLPRYAAVLFPLMLWLALWTADHRRYLAVAGASAVLLGGYTALFATGHWVA